MSGARVWEAHPALLDAVLVLSFDAQDLGVRCEPGAEPAASFADLRELCGRPSPEAELLEEALDERYAPARRRLARVGAAAVAREALGARGTALAGALWALALDAPRELASEVAYRLWLDGLAARAG